MGQNLPSRSALGDVWNGARKRTSKWWDRVPLRGVAGGFVAALSGSGPG